MERAALERPVGRLTFCTHFIDYGRYRLNCAYAAPAGSRQLTFRADMAMISLEITRDVAKIADDVHKEQWAPIISPP